MGYRIKTLSAEEAWKSLENYPYILAYEKSRVVLGRTEEISISRQDLLEARAFSESGELHLFQCEKEWTAVLTEDIADGGEQAGTTDKINESKSITRSYLLSNRFRTAGQEITVKDYLSSDEDGQVYVELTRLCGLE